MCPPYGEFGSKDHANRAQVINPLRELIVTHCATLVHSVDTLGVIILSLPDADDVQIELAAGRALAHQINGSSGTIGFDELSRLAGALESKLLDLQRQGQNVDPTHLAEVASIYRKLESAAQATSPEDSRLYGMDLSQLGRAQT